MTTRCAAAASHRLSLMSNASQCIADLFLEFAPFFKMYTQVSQQASAVSSCAHHRRAAQYVGNHDVATEMLNKLNGGHSKFQSFQTKAMQDPKCALSLTLRRSDVTRPVCCAGGNLALSSFLIMPIQRVYECTQARNFFTLLRTVQAALQAADSRAAATHRRRAP